MRQSWLRWRRRQDEEGRITDGGQHEKELKEQRYYVEVKKEVAERDAGMVGWGNIY